MNQIRKSSFGGFLILKSTFLKTADAVQWAFLVKSLLKAGLSLAAIAAVVKKNPDDVAKIAEKQSAKAVNFLFLHPLLSQNAN